MNEKIQHDGVIKSIESGQIIVSIVSKAACTGCHAKGACSAAESMEKEICITRWSESFRVGERVQIETSTGQGYRALLIAYILPMAGMVAILALTWQLTGSEPLSALTALIFATIYYLGLYLFRDKTKQALEFKLLKTENRPRI